MNVPKFTTGAVNAAPKRLETTGTEISAPPPPESVENVNATAPVAKSKNMVSQLIASIASHW